MFNYFLIIQAFITQISNIPITYAIFERIQHKYILDSY